MEYGMADKIWQNINCNIIFRSRADRRKKVTSKVALFCKIELWDTSFDYLWDVIGSEVNRKWSVMDLQ